MHQFDENGDLKEVIKRQISLKKPLNSETEFDKDGKVTKIQHANRQDNLFTWVEFDRFDNQYRTYTDLTTDGARVDGLVEDTVHLNIKDEGLDETILKQFDPVIEKRSAKVIYFKVPYQNAKEALAELPNGVPTKWDAVLPYLEKVQKGAAIKYGAFGLGAGLLAFFGIHQLTKPKQNVAQNA
jgi:hypothetical protein